MSSTNLDINIQYVYVAGAARVFIRVLSITLLPLRGSRGRDRKGISVPIKKRKEKKKPGILTPKIPGS